jgi:hypothetical protein
MIAETTAYDVLPPIPISNRTVGNILSYSGMFLCRPRRCGASASA